MHFCRFLFTLTIFSFSFSTLAELVSMSVGRSEDHIFTSREVHIQHLLEVSRQPTQASQRRDGSYVKHSEDSKAFFEQVDKTILEYLISEEAKNFSAVRLSESEYDSELKKIPTTLFQSSAWKSLESTPKEWKEIFRRKVQTEKFVQFRTQSSVIPISDVEAKRYFDENRLKFGNLPFDQFKENIKVFLRRSQVEGRLKDWYDVLRAKYKARNFLSEI